jgi:hypothetical protein
MADTNTVIMFDASLQRECAHTLDIAQNGEIVLTSIESGRFVKLPAGTDAAGVADFIAKHKAANEGQITVDAMEAEKQALLDSLNGA